MELKTPARKRKTQVERLRSELAAANKRADEERTVAIADAEKAIVEFIPWGAYEKVMGALRVLAPPKRARTR